MQLTIITVTKNNLTGLTKTLQSLKNPGDLEFEHLIVDGNSIDGTGLFVREKYPGTKFLSGHDSGPYDAMNKGVLVSRGKRILFLNAGDTLVDFNTLRILLEKSEDGDADIAYGDHLYAGSASKAMCIHRLHNRLEIGDLEHWLGMHPCHQSIISKRELLLERPFNLRLQIAADWEWLEFSRQQGKRIIYVQGVISNYEKGGISAQRYARCIAEWNIVCKFALKNRYNSEFRDVFKNMLIEHLRNKTFLRRFYWRLKSKLKKLKKYF